MKRGIICAVAALSFASAMAAGTVSAVSADENELSPACKAAYLMDEASGMQLYAKNETERLPIASMCKIMTLLLAFEAEESGELSFDEEITVSERAAGMGGSQVFLGAGLTYQADALLKSIAVCSANDSCVAIAERVCGSEGAFCERMNKRAKELGAENTLFANCTGLPKEPQYSCAKDVAIMLRALIGHEKYHEYSRIWLEDFAHPDGRTTQMTNTNKLIRSYDGCDSGKTGFTNEAGFCLAATAVKGDMRVISVAIGASDSKARFAAVSSLFDYAFDHFESNVLLRADEALEDAVCVRGSSTKEVRVAPERTLAVVRRRGAEENYTVEYEWRDALAPIAAGETLGEAVLYRDGVEVDRTALLAVDCADRYSWWEAYREGARNWN